MMILPGPVPSAPPMPPRTRVIVDGRSEWQQQPSRRVRAGMPAQATETFEERLARNRLEAACAHARAEGKREGRNLAERDLRNARSESWWFGFIFGVAVGLFVAAAVARSAGL
jgi:hypothetical protein